MAHTKNISIETSNWFRAEYDKNENLTGTQCVELFFNDVKNGAYGTKKTKPRQNYSLNKYHKK